MAARYFSDHLRRKDFALRSTILWNTTCGQQKVPRESWLGPLLNPCQRIILFYEQIRNQMVSTLCKIGTKQACSSFEEILWFCIVYPILLSILLSLTTIQSQSWSRKFQINTDGLSFLLKNSTLQPPKWMPIQPLTPIPTRKCKWLKHGMHNIKPILVEKGSGSHSNNFFPERKWLDS